MPRRVKASRSLPSAPVDEGGVLGTLRKHGGSMKVGALATATEIDKLILRKGLKLLAEAGKVVLTGATMNRRVSLPGKAPAKEEP